ncbi:flagellin [Roseovarius autotrophicus]|uniref:flagellin n=1 Tax=Roseovarius autotrophicus TaxID=2824121 RepID=UPI001B3823AA|nr:flagellin [Roseovarius autotrophicus]
MAIQSIGDLAQEFALRRQVVSLTREMNRLTQEVSTGQAADTARHLSGHLQPLADIERALVLATAQGDAARLAAVDGGLMQAALERVQSEAQGLAEAALTVSTVAGASGLAPLAAEARMALEAMIGALNVSSAGRALFAGDRSDSVPLASAGTLLSELRLVLSGQGDRAGIEAALDAFFDVPGGPFETIIYRGGADAASGVALGAGETVTLDIRAEDDALRGQIRNAAMVALLDDGVLALDMGERLALGRDLGGRLLSGQGRMVGLRARLGDAEARIAQAESRIAAERTSLSIARNDLVSVDIFASATALEGVQFQLEALYTLTVRASRLNLAAFLS